MVRKLHLNESDNPISRYQFADFVAKLNEDVDEDTFHNIEVRSAYVNRGSYNEYEIVIFDATGRLNEIGTITYTPNNKGFDITINISYKGNSISDNLTIDNLDLYSTYDYVLKKIVMFYYDYFNNDDNSNSLFGYDESLDECQLTEEQTGKDAVWLDFRLEPEMKGQLICADCEQTLNGRNCKGKLVHAVSYKWDRYDGMEWRCFCTRCYNSLKDENPDELIDSYGPSTNY